MRRRDELIAGPAGRLARALKRALQDDQNEMLTRLRGVGGGTTLDELVGVREQEERFEKAVADALAEARHAGSEFADEVCGLNGKAPRVDEGQAAKAATVLASELVGMLRQRISSGVAELGGMREAGAPDVVGAAYREWKGGRVEELAGDHATRAFAGAQVAALGAAEGVMVSWVVDDGGTACPDCDDNALAGPQPPGEPFPTGQQHPPIHPGCRCLLLPSS